MTIPWLLLAIVAVIILIILAINGKKKIEFRDFGWLLAIVLVLSYWFTSTGFNEKIWFIHLHYTGLWHVAEEDFFSYLELFFRYFSPFGLFTLIWRFLAWADSKKGLGVLFPTVSHMIAILPATIHAIVTLLLIQFNEDHVFLISDTIMSLIGGKLMDLAKACSMLMALVTLLYVPKNKREIA